MFFNELSSVFQRTTQTWQLSLSPNQRGRNRLRPGTVYFSTNSGVGDTPYRRSTRVVDGARQALLPVTGIFGTPNAQRGDYPHQGLFPKGLSSPTTKRRHQQGDNHCALPALNDRRRQEALGLSLSCPGRAPNTLLRAVASQECRAAPHVVHPHLGKALLSARKPSGTKHASPSRKRR